MTSNDSTISVSRISAVDVHAHYGPYRSRESRTKSMLLGAGMETVSARAHVAVTELTFVSPSGALMPHNDNDPVNWNKLTTENIGKAGGLGFWVVVDPGKPSTYEQAIHMLNLPYCVGMKIHPDGHGYSISERGDELLTFAHKHNAVVLSHGGSQNSKPEEFGRIANDFPEVIIIVAHLGNTWDGDPTHHVAAVQISKYGNLYVDTSSSMSALSGLLEWAVNEIGSSRILYGTDSPLYFAPMQRARIDHAELEDEDKINILRNNAYRLFGNKLKEMQ